jgi:hypothetical protein
MRGLLSDLVSGWELDPLSDLGRLGYRKERRYAQTTNDYQDLTSWGFQKTDLA